MTALNPPSRKSIPPFEALRAFDAVARLGGVRRAALSLGRDHAVVSRHLRTLEDWTGTKLVNRAPGGMVLTDEGRRYHEQIAQAMDALANATIDLVRRGDNHRLHIWCAPAFALHWMSRRFETFERAHPDVEIELRPTDRGIDFSSHETDINIRFIPGYTVPFVPASGLRAEVMARAPIIAAASPGYLAARAPVETPRDLLGHRLLHEHQFDSWANWLGAHGVHEEMDLRGLRLWQGHLTLAAALHGRGITLINKLVAADDLAAGHLVEIGRGSAHFQPYAYGSYYMVTRADRWDAPLIRRYRRWLLGVIAEQMPQVDGLEAGR